MKFYFILFVFFFCVFPFNEAKSQPIEPTLPYKGYATSVTEQGILKTFDTYKEKKNYTEALKLLATQKKKFSNELLYHRHYAEILLLQGKERDLLNHLTSLIESNSKKKNQQSISQYTALRGIFLYKLNYKNSAFQDLQKAYNSKYANLEFLLYFYSMLEERIADKILIYTVIKKTLEKDEKNDLLWFAKAKLDYQMHQPEKAYESIQKAIFLSESPLYFELALALDQIYKPHIYPSNLASIIEKYPQIFIFQLKYYNLAKKNNYLPEFIKFLKQRIQRLPASDSKNLSDFYYLLAQAQVDLKKKEEAVLHYKKSLALFYNPSTKIQLAELLWTLNRKKESALLLVEMAAKNYSTLFIYRTLAKYYSSLGLYLTAERYILQGLEHNPSDGILLYEYALLTEKIGRYEEAIKAVKELLRIKRNSSFLNHLGRLLTVAGEYSQADKYLKESLKIKKTTTTHYYLALNYYYQQNFLEAFKHLEILIKLKSSVYEVYMLAAAAKFQQKDFEKALVYIDKSTAFSKKPSFLAKTIEIESLLHLGKLDLAAETIKTYSKEDTSNSYYKRQMVFLLFLKGDREVENAIEKYLAGFQPNIRMIEILYYLKKGRNYLWNFSEEKDAIFYEKKIFSQFLLSSNTEAKKNTSYETKYSWALEQEEETDLFKRTPNNIFWNEYISGLDFFKNQNYEKSILLFNSALKKEKAIWGYFLLGLSFEGQKKYPKAADSYKKFLSAYPNNKWGLEKLAIVYDLNEQPDLSEKIYRKILAQHPNNSTALNNLSWLYLTKKQSPKNKEKALKLAQKAVSIHRNSAHLDTLAEAYFQNKEYQKAIEFIEQAVALDRNNLDHFKRQRNKFLKKASDSK